MLQTMCEYVVEMFFFIFNDTKPLFFSIFYGKLTKSNKPSEFTNPRETYDSSPEPCFMDGLTPLIRPA